MCVYGVVLINILVLQLSPPKQKFLAPSLHVNNLILFSQASSKRRRKTKIFFSQAPNNKMPWCQFGCRNQEIRTLLVGLRNYIQLMLLLTISDGIGSLIQNIFPSLLFVFVSKKKKKMPNLMGVQTYFNGYLYFLVWLISNTFLIEHVHLF